MALFTREQFSNNISLKCWYLEGEITSSNTGKVRATHLIITEIRGQLRVNVLESLVLVEDCCSTSQKQRIKATIWSHYHCFLIFESGWERADLEWGSTCYHLAWPSWSQWAVLRMCILDSILWTISYESQKWVYYEINMLTFKTWFLPQNRQWWSN